MSLDAIYNELILEHARNPQNRRRLREVSRERRGHNPSCGDEITLALYLEGDRLADVAYTGQGCAISQASTSMMVDLIKGRRIEEAKALCHDFLCMIRGESLTPEALDRLEDAQSLASLQNLPARIKCATLPWHTLERLLEETTSPSTAQ